MSTTHRIAAPLIMTLVLGGFAGFTALPISQAQDVGGQAPEDVSKQDLQMFANAYVQVSEIWNAYEPMINNAGEMDRARALQQEANRKMNRAVEDEGLSVAQYNAIFSLVKEDPALREEVNALVREMQ